MKREDTKPWYRQFWPWFIIALPASSVVAGLTTLWISMQTTDSLVVHGEDGVRKAADRRVAAQRLASEMNLAAVIDIHPETGAVTAVIRSGALDDAPGSLEFELSHPAFADRDEAVTLTKALPDADGNPVWVGHFVTVPEGRYYAVLKSGDAWRLSAEWRGETSLMLRAGGDDGS
ncbi:MAG: FixH family protein [Gammaproteobacteria bacterium]|nr:FixH family protein [Gammaproteobacteria bacterium]